MLGQRCDLPGSLAAPTAVWAELGGRSFPVLADHVSRDQGLVLNVARCPLVPPEDKEELSRAVRRLRYSRRSVLESWVNISGADEDS
eukprot:s780_g16.t1